MGADLLIPILLGGAGFLFGLVAVAYPLAFPSASRRAHQAVFFVGLLVALVFFVSALYVGLHSNQVVANVEIASRPIATPLTSTPSYPSAPAASRAAHKPRMVPLPTPSAPQALTPVTVSPAHADDLVAATGSSFPAGFPKTTPFSGLSNAQLRARVAQVVADMRRIEGAHKVRVQSIAGSPTSVDAEHYDATRKQIDDADAQAVKDFQKGPLPPVRDLHYEMLNRLHMEFPRSISTGLSINGYQALMTGILYGDATLEELSRYLEALAKRLP